MIRPEDSLKKKKLKNTDVFQHAQKYYDYYGDDLRMKSIIAAYSSVANIVILPMQDILNLNSDARMNCPGVQDGNWQWRFSWDQVDHGIAAYYKELTELYGRNGEEKEEKENKDYLR